MPTKEIVAKQLLTLDIVEFMESHIIPQIKYEREDDGLVLITDIITVECGNYDAIPIQARGRISLPNGNPALVRDYTEIGFTIELKSFTPRLRGDGSTAIYLVEGD